MTPKVVDAVRTGPAPKLDIVGSVLSAAGLGLRRPRDAAVDRLGLDQAQGGLPGEPFGFSLTLFVIGFGPFLLWAFTRGRVAESATDRDPLVHLALLKIAPLRVRPDRPVQPEPDPDGRLLHDPAVPAAGDRSRRPGDRSQDASRLHHHVPRLGRRLTALRPLPHPLDRARRAGDRRVAAILLLATIEPELDNSSFAWSMAVLGVGMGLIASQLGNVVQSSVDASGRGRPAVCSSPASSSARRWASPCSVPSCCRG